MAEDQPSGRDALPERLVATLADPATARSRTPYLLGVLDDGTPSERLVAGTALCLVAETDPELRGAVTERLLDRVDGDHPLEVRHALDYLAARHPEAVDRAVEEHDTADRRARDRRSRSETEGGFVRSEYRSPGERDRPVGRTQVAGEGSVEDPRSVYTSDATDRDDEPTPTDRDEPGDGNGDRGDEDAGDEGGDEKRANAGQRGDPAAEAAVESERGATTVTLRAVSRRLSEIVAATEFDELTVLTEGRRDRYGVVYRTAGRLDGDDYAVALRVYRLPDDRGSFAAGFRTIAQRWEAVDDHRAVLPVYDWGVRPRPWAALEYAGESLAARSNPPDEPLWTVLELASAVAHAHQRGLVHGAIDPGNVVYRDALLDDSRRQPLLTNPGFAGLAGTPPGGDDRVSEEKQHAEPDGVDPRYAAPEHYDDSYGRVDAATDVYGLGALLCRLCTDHHPYTGDAATVRGKVLSEGGPEPRRVNPDLPDSLHRVVRKATATRKLKRYETVTAFRRELTQARERLLEAVDDG